MGDSVILCAILQTTLPRKYFHVCFETTLESEGLSNGPELMQLAVS